MRHQAIRNLYSNVITIIDSNPTQILDAGDNGVIIDEDLVQAEVDRLQAEYDAQKYARNRATEYPALADQLDEIYHNGIDSWKAVIKVTKDKYPKG